MYEFINAEMNPTAAFTRVGRPVAVQKRKRKDEMDEIFGEDCFLVLGFKNPAKFPLEDVKK